jgi:hypothetical protein
LVGGSVANFRGIAISLDERAIHNPSLRSIRSLKAADEAENQREEHFQSRKAQAKLNYTFIGVRRDPRDQWGIFIVGTVSPLLKGLESGKEQPH